ncbi:hypothetical protein M3175_01610 [Robertmurraya korlensis]|uniref:hypothetical protein n=1 Tax=Robertmurraya korlensis TaxID=519977 RepID=UPI00203C7909|nr:hypothetical protein [Robertmurraya korlensis]MCM3599412.1 hypothetical protein [Robertmurraya korlensis]
MSSKLIVRLVFFGLIAIMIISFGLKFIEGIAEGPKEVTNGKKVVVNKEKEEEGKTEATESNTPISTTKTEITQEEFEAKYKQDPEETQYPNGKFELTDGSTVNADFISYGENELFDYATAIYSDGKLASIQFETSAAIEEIEDALGMKFEDSQVEQNRIGYEITLNDTFSEANIAVYPFEWE